MELPQFTAHGRVNLIGEHTDYNLGWVLPTLIPQSTRVAIRRREDQRVGAVSRFGRAEYDLGGERKRNDWIDYIQGATKILRELGHAIRGFELEIESTVPFGSGLSSSAALEIAVLRALRASFHLEINDIEIAQVGQRIENEFVGAKVGIMDQMVVSVGQEKRALFLDTQNLQYEEVAIPFDLMDLVVINSGIKHRLGDHDGGYNQRRAECEKACKLLKVSSLREVPLSDLARLTELPEIIRRRARHVITENERVHLAVRALRGNQIADLGELFYQSHASMRDDYQVSIPEIDILVDLCRSHSEAYGARLTGGGFGGSIVALTQKGHGSRIANAVVASYREITGETGSVMVP